MKTRSLGLLWLLLPTALISACGSDDSGGGGSNPCPTDTPIECRGASSELLGCCPTTHPTCSADGLSCEASGTGGTGGTGASAGSGGGAGTSGSGGATGGTGGASGGTGGATGGTGGASGGTGGATGGTGGASGGTGGATGGTGGGATCTDQGFEPNETSGTATDLGSSTDCDGTGKVVFAKLDGATDVDWYKYKGTDTSCIVDPAVTLDVNAWLCMYFTCPGVTVSCKGTSTSASDGPGPGCCSSTGGTLKATPSCTGAEDTTVYIRVDLSAKNECVNYSIDYHY
jgi:hypothetical protein